MFSKWREFLTFTAFPPLKRPNSEPELNSPNFEAFSDDEEWILVREKKKNALDDTFTGLKLGDNQEVGASGMEAQSSKHGNQVILTGRKEIISTEPTNTDNMNKKIALNFAKAMKARNRQIIDEKIQQRKQIEELLFENTNHQNNPNNFHKHYYKISAKETRNQLRRRAKQINNETKRRRKRDMSC